MKFTPLNLVLLFVCMILVGFLCMLQFYPEDFSFSQPVRGVMKIAGASVVLAFAYLIERENKKNR